MAADRAAAFFDLDRTLLGGASGPLLNEALIAAGLLPDRHLPGENLVFKIYEVVGETLVGMALARRAAGFAAGCAAAGLATGFAVETGRDGAMVLRDERAVQHPDDVATVLVHAGCPPTRLMVEREDLETYFLRLVGAAPAAGEDGDA